MRRQVLVGEWILELRIELAARREEFKTPSAEGHRHFAVAALYRGVDQLAAGHSLCLMHPDSVGLLARAAWECWLVGIFLHLGGPEAFLRLAAEQVRQELNLTTRNNFDASHVLDPLRDCLREVREDLVAAGSAQWVTESNGEWPRWNLESLCRDVSELWLSKTGESVDVAMTYNRVYRGHSAFDTHGLRALERYVGEGFGSPDTLVIREPQPWIEPESALLAGLLPLLELALLLYEDFGIDPERLEEIKAGVGEVAQEIAARVKELITPEVLAAVGPDFDLSDLNITTSDDD